MRNLVVLLLVGLLVAASHVVAEGQGGATRCHVWHYHQNDDRTVPGPVNVECGGGIDPRTVSLCAVRQLGRENGL